MKRGMIIMLAVVSLFSIWASVDVQAFQIITKQMMETETVTKTDLIRTVDNFIILFDTSDSTNGMVPGRDVSKIAAAKAMLKERNSWLPDLGYNAGLFIYTNNEALAGTFKEVYPIQPYDRDRFAAAIDQLPDNGQGPTLLQAGLHNLHNVVANLSGKTAVVMFTDGSFTIFRGTKKPVQIAQEIAKDNDVCFYLISSASDDVNQRLLEAVSKVNACSRVIPLATFLDNPDYLGGALFTVKTTSYDRLVPTTQVVGAVADNTLFDFNSSDIRPEFKSNLDQIGNYLQSNPDAYAVAAGFSDSVGEEEYNLALSEHRAQSVKSYLVGTHGISPDRIVTLWFGELNPVADNATASGRALNRRVEVAVGTGNAM